jgi:hypothetical protein
VSKLFDTAARKQTIAVGAMSQVRECGRALGLGAAEDEMRSSGLALAPAAVHTT